MTKRTVLQFWDLWYPQAGSTGLPFARGRLAVMDSLLVHARRPHLRSRFAVSRAAAWPIVGTYRRPRTGP